MRKRGGSFVCESVRGGEGCLVDSASWLALACDNEDEKVEPMEKITAVGLNGEGREEQGRRS
jgi:hypothetical protein